MIFARLFVRTRWLNSASGALVVLLQRTPVVRALLTTEAALTAPATSLLRSALPAAATLGAVHTLVGATTQLVASVGQPAKATVGSSFAEAVTITGAGVSYAQSWKLSNTLPPGIVAQGAVLQNGQLTVNPSTGTLVFIGTPTTAGTYSISISGYQYTGFTGPATNATATIVVADAPNSAPLISRQPANVITIVGSSAVFSVAFTGAPTPTIQWSKNGADIGGATATTLALNNVSASDAGNYSVKLTNALGSATSLVATLTVNAAPAAPAFTLLPVAQIATAGNDVTLAVTVTGVPTPTLQWLRNGSNIAGATGTTLTLTNVQSADAGTYSVTATNSAGIVTSSAAGLTVNPAAAAPVFSSPPLSQTVATGATVVFLAPAIGTPTPSYQWLLNGNTIPGETSATLMVSRVTAANAGSYTAVAQNSLGQATSSAAALVVAATNDPGRLTNLSVITDLSATAPSFTVGTVLGGAGTSGIKPLVVRAAGPALVAFGVPGTLADPVLNLLAGQTVVASNDNWGGAPVLAAAMAGVGAFPYTSADSKDAAIYAPTLPARDYTVAVSSAVPAGSGTVIAEIYDATPAGTYTTTTPRLINVSVLKQIAPSGSLTLGFTIGGSTAKTVLVRAIGPGLASVGVASGTLADPRLTLYDSTSTAIATNHGWGGNPSLAQAMSRVGAFAVTNASSNDSMLLLTLPPGGYTATASDGAGGGGLAIVEVYEVP